MMEISYDAIPDEARSWSSRLGAELTQWLHALPRTNTQFEHVSNDFDPADENYMQGVIIWSAPLAFCAVLALLCCPFAYFCCASRKRKEKLRRTPRCACISFSVLFAFGLLLLGVIGIFMNAWFSVGFARLLTTVDDESHAFEQRAASVANILDTVLPNPATHAIAEHLLQVARDIREMSSMHMEDIKNGESLRFVVVIIGLVASIIASLSVCGAASAKKRWSDVYAVLIVQFLVFLCFLVAAVEFPVSLISADICVDTDAAIQTATRDLPMEQRIGVTYFLQCVDENGVFADAFDVAEGIKEQLEMAINATTDPVVKKELEEQLGDVVKAIHDLTSLLTCEQTRAIFVKFSGDLCARCIYYLNVLLCVHILLSCFGAGIFCCLGTLKRSRESPYLAGYSLLTTNQLRDKSTYKDGSKAPLLRGDNSDDDDVDWQQSTFVASPSAPDYGTMDTRFGDMDFSTTTGTRGSTAAVADTRRGGSRQGASRAMRARPLGGARQEESEWSTFK